MTLAAGRCVNGHLRYPVHPQCPVCGADIQDTVDVSDETGEIITWTESTSTPPGVRTPNPIAIVELTTSDRTVRAIGQLTTGNVEIGDTVRPVPVDSLRDPDAGLIRETTSQSWDGYLFEPVG